MPDRERKPGTIGVAIPGCEMKLVGLDGQDVGAGEGVGEIAIRGDNVMKGYWNKPEATAEAIPDGWFRTGDLATVDEEGYYTIVDRKKDMILRGGMNVYPREVEEALYTHPDVLEAAVVSVPDDLLGEEVGAAVALRPGATATLEDVQAHVKEQIAAYKYPRHIWLVDELPKTATGKILRREAPERTDARTALIASGPGGRSPRPRRARSRRRAAAARRGARRGRRPRARPRRPG
jgi:long-chain acyl-CoA synthetase